MMAARRASPSTRAKTPGRTAGARRLKEYRAKRRFDQTPEPAGKIASTPGLPRFTIQKHDATRLHYDLRLEVEGTLKSWAVPKGPSVDPADRRLAVRTEDHPIEYLTFEGVIPEGQYGAGPMIVWDSGTYLNIKQDRRGRSIPMSKALEKGSVKIWLEGKKIKGGFALVRTGSGRSGGSGKEQWFLVKLKDEHAAPGRELLEKRPESVVTGKTIQDLGERKRRTRSRGSAQGADSKGRTRQGATKPATRQGVPSHPEPAEEPGTVFAKRGRDPRPDWIPPMLATLVDQPVAGDEWVLEHKYDGFRALAFRHGDKVRLLSRNNKNLADRFPEIAEAIRQQPLKDFIVDGEIVALKGSGRRARPSFSELQKRLKETTLAAAQRGGVMLRFYIFDLLYAAGYDTRRLGLTQRKQLLQRAIAFQEPLHFSGHRAISGKNSSAALKKACREGWEGLIAKRAADAYTSGRSRSWLKLKCSLRQEFVIGGYTDPQGSRAAFGSLLVGYHPRAGDHRLIYAGRVGTGYTDRLLREVLAKLQRLQRKTSPFEPDPEIPRRGVHFADPRLVCEVGFSEWTHDHHIRHPRFEGLRPDRDPAEVVREEAAKI
jgi:bifunctional non-homologous end joining protein LigD